MRKPLYVRILQYLAMVLLVIFIISPFLWLVIMSVSTSADLTTKPLRWIPSQIDFSSFKELLTMGDNSRGELFVSALRNSLTTALSAVSISLLVTVPAAWLLSRYSGKKNMILGIAIFTFMLPPIA